MGLLKKKKDELPEPPKPDEIETDVLNTGDDSKGEQIQISEYGVSVARVYETQLSVLNEILETNKKILAVLEDINAKNG